MQRCKYLKKTYPLDANKCKEIALEREQMYIDDIGNGNWEQHLREDNISLSVSYAIIQHLEVFRVDCLEDKLNTGVDRSIEYFLGDWWKTNEIDVGYMDKTSPERALIWGGPYLHAAFLCGLTGRWDDLRGISEWVDESVYPEITFGAVEDEYMLFLLYVASSLRSKPLSRHDRLQAAIENGRPKRPRLLLKSFQTAMAGDQAGFSKAIVDSLKNCEKSEVEAVPNFNYWVGVPQSFVNTVAEKNGLSLPELPPNLDALLVRRSTIGL